jgi:DNA-directed RNA polymerase subunit RPC12/RpoP
MTTYECSSCGAAIEIKNRFSKVVVCQYCGTHHRVTVEGLDPSGKHPKLAEFPSIFKVGSRGTILGKPFTANGRIRYKYSGGFFDEWFLDYDGEPAWFAEDEGAYTLYTEQIEAVDVPENIDSVRAGQNLMIGDKKVMIKEKGKAVIEGGEGELSYSVEPGTQVIYIDAVWNGKKASIEYTEDELEFFIGRPVLKKDIAVEG